MSMSSVLFDLSRTYSGVAQSPTEPLLRALSMTNNSLAGVGCRRRADRPASGGW